MCRLDMLHPLLGLASQDDERLHIKRAPRAGSSGAAQVDTSIQVDVSAVTSREGHKKRCVSI